MQGEWADASSAAEAAQHYYMQAKLAAESAQRYASTGPGTGGPAPTNMAMPPANGMAPPSLGAPPPGNGIPPEFLLPNASRPPSGRILSHVATLACLANLPSESDSDLHEMENVAFIDFLPSSYDQTSACCEVTDKDQHGMCFQGRLHVRVRGRILFDLAYRINVLPVACIHSRWQAHACHAHLRTFVEKHDSEMGHHAGGSKGQTRDDIQRAYDEAPWPLPPSPACAPKGPHLPLQRLQIHLMVRLLCFSTVRQPSSVPLLR